MMMRCKNCGWDKSPAGSVKCVKCNALLEGSMMDMDATVTDRQVPPEEFNSKQTTSGCPDCGYPVRPTDTDCPNCGRRLIEAEKPKPSGPEPQKPGVHKRTIIKGVKNDSGKGEHEKRKLVGFLVTYSFSPNGDFFPIYEGTNSIGRAASNDIVIADDSVSGEHLVIAYYSQNKKFYFETVGLTQNGAYLNDRFFPKGGDEIVNFDVITIGSTKLIFIVIPEITTE